MNKFLLLAFGVALLSACKKDSDPVAPTASRTDMLTAKNWKLTSENVSITMSGVTLPVSTLEDCQKDDAYKFNTDKSLVVDAGANKCDTSDPQKETGTWSFSNTDQTKLKMTLPNSIVDGELDIKELTSSTLHVSATETNAGATYTIDATFTSY
jgi:hypothetical protein